jgi:mannose-6-phosphate isomerase-like protein (cupin superfamily)
MNRISAPLVLVLGLLVGLPVVHAQPPPKPDAQAAAPALYVLHASLASEMKQSIAKHANPATATIGMTDDYSIHEVQRLQPGPPAIHPGYTELHYVLSGGGIFVTGGRIVATSTGAKVVEGGIARNVRAGDAIIIPPDTPHWYKQIDGSIRYLEVRFKVPASSGASR